MTELLLTGASGFIGSNVRTQMPDSIRVTPLSVRNDDWRNVDFSKFDAVLHAAGIAHVLDGNVMDETYHEVNCVRTLEIAEKAKKAGVGLFVFLSSIIVFGAPTPAGAHAPITPQTAPNPENAYGKSKLDAENGLRAMEADSFRVAILRLPMVYGKGCKGNYTRLASLARKCPLFPAFDNRRSMLYIENLTSLIAKIVFDCPSGTYHPRDGVSRSTGEIARAICAAHGKKCVQTRLLAPAVRLMGKGGIVRRAFGDQEYASDMPDYPENYRAFDFESAIRKTEGDEKW